MKKVLIKIIRFYQLSLSPDKGFLIRRSTCRFYPSCSDYFIQALERLPFYLAVWLGVKRICRCHPFGGKGCDPLPDCKNKNITN